MKRKTLKMTYTAWVLIAVFLMASIVSQAEAVVAGPTNITIKHACISMPDGTVTAPTGVPAVNCPAGTIKMWLPADNAVVPVPPATNLLSPGSFVITADVTDTLTITVSNELAIPVSLVIPGQVMTPNNGPVWFSDIAHPYTSLTAIGNRPTPTNAADPEDPAFKYRVRSFSHETAAGAPGAPGATTTYTWPSPLRPGTYLILSGTHPALQVQMGIYGVLVVTDGGVPYAGIAATQTATLLFSEIDPAIHNAADDAAMAAATPTIPSTNDFRPKYFLINGKAFPANNPVPIGAAGSTTLLRFANAGLDTYVPLLQGQSMQVIAEDGYLKAANLRFIRHSVDLHAGKTFDALLTNPAAGHVPLYDRRLYLSNAAQAPGGMMAYLEVGGPGPNTLNVATNGGTGTGRVAAESAPGGIYCDTSKAGSDCTQTYFANTQVKLTADPNPGSALAAVNPWTGCTTVTAAKECLVTMDAATKNVTANFRAFNALQLLSPNGGEVVLAGSQHLVQWGAPANAAKFRLRYSLDGGTTWILIKKDLIGNSFSWTVPTPGQNRKSAILQITAFNANGVVMGSDVSNAPFTIDTLRVTVPALGATLASGNIGAPHTITWVSGATPGLVKKVVIEYTKNNGTTWLPVVVLDNTTGIYDTGGSFNGWEIAAVAVNKPNSFVRITLKDAANNIIGRDRSDKFTITVP